MHSVGSGVSVDEEEKDEDEELGHDDDEEDVDEINHTQLSKEVGNQDPVIRMDHIGSTRTFQEASTFRFRAEAQRKTRKSSSTTRRVHPRVCQFVTSQRSTYGLSENEKVLSVIARWGTYASMKV